MIQFINMDFNGTQWWIEYEEDGTYHTLYFNTEAEAQTFYASIVNNS